MMAKEPPQIPTSSDTLAMWSAKIPTLQAGILADTAAIVAIEQVNKAGVPAVLPKKPVAHDDEDDVAASALKLLNGAAADLQPMLAKGDDQGVILFRMYQARKAKEFALDLARKRVTVLQGELSREAADEHRETKMALHRHRALLIVSLLKANEEIEALRSRTSVGGFSADSALEGFTLRLFGLASQPSPMNTWPRRYLEACITAKIITSAEANLT